MIFYPIFILLLAISTVTIIPIVQSVIAAPMNYMYMGIGIAVYTVVTILFNRNLEWLRTFSHELSHTVVGLMFFRKIHSFEAGVGSGVMTHSGGIRFGDIFISLAPYCLPLFTYILLFLRELGADKSLYIFDIMIGITAAFHIGCFRRQTGLYQSDIRDIGIARSLLFIVTMWIVNLSILLLSIRTGVIDAIKEIAIDYWDTAKIWYNWVADFATTTFSQLF